MTQHDSTTYITDILDSIKAINAYVANKQLHDFVNDDFLRDAVYMRLQVIGESAGKISQELTSKHPEIPWRQIVALRNMISHSYSYLDSEEIWLLVQNDLPPLEKAVQDLSK